MNNLNIKLISEEYVKSRSSVMNNVENTFISNNILSAQDMYIQDVLGSNLYNLIIGEFEAYVTAQGLTSSTLLIDDYVSDDNLYLVDNYIQPCLLFYTLYESSDDLYFKFTNKGMVTQTSDNSQTLSENLYKDKKNDYLSKAEFYSNRLINYIKDNRTKYPTWFEGKDEYSDIIPNDEPYLYGGWYLKKTKRRCEDTWDF